MGNKWTVVDFKVQYRDNGCNVEADDWYKITNGASTKWVDEYKFYRMKGLGLISDEE